MLYLIYLDRTEYANFMQISYINTPYGLFCWILHLSQKANFAGNVIITTIIIGQRVLRGSFIRHVIDLFGEIIQAKRCFFKCIIPEIGRAMVG